MSKASDPVTTAVATQGPVALDVAGLQQAAKLYVHDTHDTVIAPALLRDGCWERLESELLLHCLNPGDGVLDIGANIGYFSVLSALSVGPHGRVWAFEPAPANTELLRQNIRLNRLDRVVPVQAALGRDAGSLQLFLSSTNSGDHSLVSRQDCDSVTVDVIRGDDYLPEDAVIHLIKIDVQGAEPSALAGLEKTIERNISHLRIMLEFCPGAMDAMERGSAEYLLDCMTRWDKPVYAIDHWRDALVETSVKHLRDWLGACRNENDKEGFFNLLIGEPPEGIQRLAVCAC